MPILILIVLLTFPINSIYAGDYAPSVNNLFKELKDLNEIPAIAAKDYSTEDLDLENMPITDEVKKTDSSIKRRRYRKNPHSDNISDQEEVIEMEGDAVASATSKTKTSKNKKRRIRKRKL